MDQNLYVRYLNQPQRAEIESMIKEKLANSSISSQDLSYNQCQVVRGIITEEMHKNDWLDVLKTSIEKMHLEQKIRDTTDKIVPKVCDNWVHTNMKPAAETYFSDFLSRNFGSHFNREMNQNKQIASHLEEVKKRVSETSDSVIYRMVSDNTALNPVLQQCVSVLTDRNKVLFDNHAAELKTSLKELRQSTRSLNNAMIENSKLDMRLGELEKSKNSLERTNNVLTGVSILSLAGVLGLGVKFFSKI